MRRPWPLLLPLAGLMLPVGLLHAREAPWTRLDAGNVTILSDEPTADIRQWAVEFELFHRGLGNLLTIHEALLQPVKVVLFRTQAELRPYKFLEKGKPANINGLFARSPLGNLIGAAADSEDEQTRRVIFHEATHWLTNVSETPLPLWLDEGLAEVYSTFSIEDGTYTFGTPVPAHVALLRRERMMPLKELMAIHRGSLLYNEGQRVNIFYAESWAFVHFMLFSGNHEEASKFNALLRALQEIPDPDAAFRKVFGVDCAGMESILRGYIDHGKYSGDRFRFNRSATESAFTLRPATPAEIDLAESSLLCVAHRPAEAAPRLARIVMQTPRDPLAWAAKGYAAYQMEDFPEARTSFERAAELGSRNPFVYSFLGDSAIGLRRGVRTAVRDVSTTDARRAVDLYERALALNPRDQHAYDNCATASYILDALTPLDKATLEQGARLYRGDAQIMVGLAVVALREGRRDLAVAALRKIAADPSYENREAARYAQGVLNDTTWVGAMDRINALLEKRNFRDALAEIQDAQGLPITAADRSQLERIGGQAKFLMDLDRAVDLVNSGKPDEARTLLHRAISSTDDPNLKAQAQGLLDKINKRLSGE